MNNEQIKKKRQTLITPSNPEWQEILDLRSLVQNDFEKKGFLAQATFHNVLEWKLRDQPSLIDRIKKTNPDSLVEPITRCYNDIDHPEEEFKTRAQVHTLLGLPWIGISVVSAIMAMHEPKFYGTLDSKSWTALFNKEKKSLSGGDYLNYLKRIREIAVELDCDVQEIDYILSRQ